MSKKDLRLSRANRLHDNALILLVISVVILLVAIFCNSIIDNIRLALGIAGILIQQKAIEIKGRANEHIAAIVGKTKDYKWEQENE